MFILGESNELKESLRYVYKRSTERLSHIDFIGLILINYSEMTININCYDMVVLLICFVKTFQFITVGYIVNLDCFD